MHNIHLVMSAKGGVGKSILVYGLYKHFLNQRRRVVLFDSNQMNQDIYGLMLPENTELEDTGLCWQVDVKRQDGTKLEALEFKYKEWFDNNWGIYRLSSPYNLVGHSFDFWGHILRIASNQGDASQIIVDTNMHPLNIVTLGESPFETRIRSDANAVLKSLSSLGGKSVRIYVWFIWSIRPLIDYAYYENNEYSRHLGSVYSSINQQTNHHFQIIHVFNPVAFKPPVDEVETSIPFFSLFGKKDDANNEQDKLESQEVKGLMSLWEKESSDTHMDLNNFRQWTGSAINEGFKGTNAGAFFLELAKKLPQFSNHGGKRPWNIAGLPRYYPKLHAFIDNASMHLNDMDYIDKVTKGVCDDLSYYLERTNL